MLERLPAKHAQQIDARIQRLAAEPFPPTSLKLQAPRTYIACDRGRIESFTG